MKLLVLLVAAIAVSYASGCDVDGKKYKSGERFVPNDCSGYCKCTGHGGHSCVDLCPPMRIRCKSHQHEVMVKEKVRLNEKCSCRRPKCVGAADDTLFAMEEFQDPARKGVCKVDGNTYKSGERFTPDDCRGYCKCEEHGGISCVDLCPPYRIRCPKPKKIIHKKVKVGNSHCTCSRPKCVAEKKKDEEYYDVYDPIYYPLQNDEAVCKVDGKRYKAGEYFVPNDCRGSCKCGAGGSFHCNDLCPPYRIRCHAPKKLIKVTVPNALNRKCSCRRPKCVSEKKDEEENNLTDVDLLDSEKYDEATCKVDGKSYKAGDRFVPDDCRGHCKCEKHGGISCVGLCPLYRVRCPKPKKLIHVRVKVGDSKCTCRREKCVEN